MDINKLMLVHVLMDLSECNDRLSKVIDKLEYVEIDDEEFDMEKYKIIDRWRKINMNLHNECYILAPKVHKWVSNNE